MIGQERLVDARTTTYTYDYDNRLTEVTKTGQSSLHTSMTPLAGGSGSTIMAPRPGRFTTARQPLRRL